MADRMMRRSFMDAFPGYGVGANDFATFWVTVEFHNNAAQYKAGSELIKIRPLFLKSLEKFRTY